MISDDLKQWWRKFDDVERCVIIKNKSICVNKAHQAMTAAVEKEIAGGLNRTGKRGGKITSLQANSIRYTKSYLEEVEELKYFVSTL